MDDSSRGIVSCGICKLRFNKEDLMTHVVDCISTITFEKEVALLNQGGYTGINER